MGGLLLDPTLFSETQCAGGANDTATTSTRSTNLLRAEVCTIGPWSNPARAIFLRNSETWSTARRDCL
eukprot:3420085-Rhodomonas_salina.1